MLYQQNKKIYINAELNASSLFFLISLLAVAENEHCGICKVLVINADNDVQEEDISPMTPMTPSCINEIAENTACVIAACPSTDLGYESFSISVMYAPGIKCCALISATANRIAEIPLKFIKKKTVRKPLIPILYVTRICTSWSLLLSTRYYFD